MDPGAPCVQPASAGIARIPLLDELLGARVLRGRARLRPGAPATVVAGWGARPSAQRAERLAARRGLACWRLEDGFLRSFGLGDAFPPLSISVDPVGVHFDAGRPSALENMLASDRDLLAGIGDDVSRARAAIVANRLSKYNHAPELDPDSLPAHEGPRVLVVDQSAGDASIALAGATASTFHAMLLAARRENPGAQIIVKTHPDTNAGRRRGHLAEVQSDASTVVVSADCNPHSLLERVDIVYVVSSLLGFEALLANRTVHCFGMPWYAGWGATEDRLSCPRRVRRRTVDELFAAAYFHHCRYLDPVTHARGTIFDVIEFLARQRRMAAAQGERTLCVGFRRWKQYTMGALIALHRERVQFLPDAPALRAARPDPSDRVLVWGAGGGDAIEAVVRESGARLVRVEDGFVRSVGLGSDLVRPVSLVFDEKGIYFDPRLPSDLECLLRDTRFTDRELQQAAQLREALVQSRLTKYNTVGSARVAWRAGTGRRRLLVPGQVADDASVRLAGAGIAGNLALLRAVRQRHPDAFIVYKPHPDVVSGNRKGRLRAAELRGLVDHVETDGDIIACIMAADEVHTLSSLAGFDALLRGKPVHTYGRPFYAGWGLTHDRVDFASRRRRLLLDELVAGSLLRYPVYWDWTLMGYTSGLAAVAQLRRQRDAAGRSGVRDRGYLRRQWRKLDILRRAWMAA